MPGIIVQQMPLFKKAYKRLPSEIQSVLDEAIKEIINDPTIGEEKKSDLNNVFVYKIKVHVQEYLLAYEWSPKTRLVLVLGLHENVYRDLKNNRSLT